jgi:hypothetical protein
MAHRSSAEAMKAILLIGRAYHHPSPWRAVIGHGRICTHEGGSTPQTQPRAAGGAGGAGGPGVGQPGRVRCSGLGEDLDLHAAPGPRRENSRGAHAYRRRADPSPAAPPPAAKWRLRLNVLAPDPCRRRSTPRR